jgi:phosphoglycerol transferase MdoB-like AlkP superfamily enzyme
MISEPPNPSSSCKRSRYGFAVFWFLTMVFAWLVLRLICFAAFKPSGISAAEICKAFLSGSQRDVFVALVFTLPLLFWFWIIPNPRFARRGHRIFFLSASFVACYAFIFNLFVEYFFFEEFKSRFNTVAVDYLIYPYEVFVNIWESYHVGIIVVLCLVLTAGWLFAVTRLFDRMWDQAYSARSRFLHFVAPLTLAVVLGFSFNFKAAHVGDDRTLNEIANNGVVSFVAAALTRDLDYAAFYKTLPPDEAYSRARRILLQTNDTFLSDGRDIRRKVAGELSRPRLNVVILLEESLGSEFWGSLGRKQTLTPEMDKLAAEEGMLFTNIYACGNRTVRGMEGVLSSFPPLPGDSIVKRDHSAHVETIARVLKRDGYSTHFIYGGRGVFDGMRSYAVRNGYDRFIEQKDFPHPTFTTAWGVCDEDLMIRAIDEFRELSRAGQPFFATLLSVSNHRPYTYPKGRIPENPDQQWRKNAVKYADYALGEFFRRARHESFWTNTIFAVVADHGARVYGKQSIPIHSYEIPVLIAGPAVVHAPARIGQLGNSLDVSPTLLGLIGRPYETIFFGRDLFKMKPDEGRAYLNHNRDIGMLAHDRLVVLGLRQTVEFYEGNPKEVDMSLLTQPTDADKEIEKDAISIYQVADDLYTHSRYRVD